MDVSQEVDFSDVQGLVVRGYGTLPAACYLLLKIEAREGAREWLQALTERTCFAARSPDNSAINFALSYHGLQALGLEPAILETFSDEFRSGMTSPHKRRILGDEGSSAPERWDWGGPETPPVDILVLCYAANDKKLEVCCSQVRASYPEDSIAEIARLDTETLREFKEHFGFRDSIGQPYIREFDHRTERSRRGVPLGEFLLGYRNGYDRLTQRPMVAPEHKYAAILSLDSEGSGLRDLGKNGAYLVFRQISQDVRAFWSYLSEQAGGEMADIDAVVRLGARMVGRWPSGTPLVKSPDTDSALFPQDDFAYHHEDPHGYKCPLGAHIRRTHPRDSLDPEPGSEKSLAFSNRHRLLRRGRAYGAPFHPSMDPAQVVAHLDEEALPQPRGLHFICLNANIGRQFEFVQHTWANNPTFNGLYRDPDPLIGPRHPFGMAETRFTIQQCPIRAQFANLPDFTHTRGGGYFFLPSHRAMRFLFGPQGSRP